jgi:hypothetical protein
VEYALQIQIQNALHALTSQLAIRHCMYQQANQQMQTTVDGYASLSVMNAPRWVYFLFDCWLSAQKLMFTSSGWINVGKVAALFFSSPIITVHCSPADPECTI